MNKCIICGASSNVGIDFIPYYDYQLGHVEGKFRYLYHFCNIHFLLSYHAFYISTSVGWKINYNFSDDEEVKQIVADCIGSTAKNITRHNDGSSMVHSDGRSNTGSVCDAWSISRKSDTKQWRRKKGGKAK